MSQLSLSSASTARADGRASEAPGHRVQTLARWLCWGQGVFYLATGVWPLVSIDTFQTVTGAKTDLWLVRTVGALIAVIGLVLLSAAWRNAPTFEVRLLAVGAAFALTVVDIVYVSGGILDPVYLLDAVAEGLLIGGWLVVGLLEQRSA